MAVGNGSSHLSVTSCKTSSLSFAPAQILLSVGTSTDRWGALRTAVLEVPGCSGSCRNLSKILILEVLIQDASERES